MSNIGDYYALLGAMNVQFTGQDSTAYNLTALYDKTLKTHLEAADLPVRVLLPYSDRDTVDAVVEEFRMGNAAPITWTIIDQLLWRPIGEGIGLEDSAYDLREYMAAYFTGVMAFDASSISDLMLTDNVRVILRDDINFPRGSANWYIGADVIWTVIEDDPL